MARKPAASKTEASNTSKDELLKYYRDMLLIRRFEEKAGQLYGMGLIGGFCHLYIGQEAVVVGLEAAAKEGDKRVTSYRDHGHMLACGMDPNGVMAELTGREGGYSKGKGGSMHMFSREKHFYGGHGIVGAQVPLGAGLAFADKYLGNDNVTFVYYGDGAANQGQVYETYNMAELWDLPVVFVIENNQYAMGTSVKRSTKSTSLFGRGEAFGIKPTFAKNPRGDDDMRGTCIEPAGGVVGIHASAELESAGEGGKGFARGGFIAGTKLDDMPATQVVLAIQLRVPRGGAVGNKVGLRTLIRKRAADNLFHSSLMQIDAGSKHGGKIRGERPMTNVKIMFAWARRWWRSGNWARACPHRR